MRQFFIKNSRKQSADVKGYACPEQCTIGCSGTCSTSCTGECESSCTSDCEGSCKGSCGSVLNIF